MNTAIQTPVSISNPSIYKVFHGEDKVTSEVIARMDREGYRPATVDDLLDFQKKKLGTRGKYPLVALSPSTEKGWDSTAYVRNFDSDGYRYMHDDGGTWGYDRWFLGVRKEPT